MTSTTYGQARAALSQTPPADVDEQALTPLQTTAGALLLLSAPLFAALIEGLL